MDVYQRFNDISGHEILLLEKRKYVDCLSRYSSSSVLNKTL